MGGVSLHATAVSSQGKDLLLIIEKQHGWVPEQALTLWQKKKKRISYSRREFKHVSSVFVTMTQPLQGLCHFGPNALNVGHVSRHTLNFNGRVDVTSLTSCDSATLLFIIPEHRNSLCKLFLSRFLSGMLHAYICVLSLKLSKFNVLRNCYLTNAKPVSVLHNWMANSLSTEHVKVCLINQKTFSFLFTVRKKNYSRILTSCVFP